MQYINPDAITVSLKDSQAVERADFMTECLQGESKKASLICHPIKAIPHMDQSEWNESCDHTEDWHNWSCQKRY